ncbi:hypothetical protein EJ04DRAFT_339164 [Polyplosphaeria fusca]|uniref:Uncharacterized protein n=1 Tax=Polyplosphaeria fusca TaxID=682080 RepID=A0A9P4QWN7_9PLEO|nr:hypothetical protein EJ04DRAFT_339164 [Polyplosphaeria fusca]
MSDQDSFSTIIRGRENCHQAALHSSHGHPISFSLGRVFPLNVLSNRSRLGLYTASTRCSRSQPIHLVSPHAHLFPRLHATANTVNARSCMTRIFERPTASPEVPSLPHIRRSIPVRVNRRILARLTTSPSTRRTSPPPQISAMSRTDAGLVV